MHSTFSSLTTLLLDSRMEVMNTGGLVYVHSVLVRFVPEHISNGDVLV